MAKIRSTKEIAEKWARVAPTRATDYENGIKKPLRDWEANAVAAESAWEEGVSKAVSEKRFAKGVAKAGTEKWQRRTLAKGPRRWSEGISVAQPDYEAGFAPFRDVIEATELPPRYPKGDPRNIDRVAAIARALHEKKLELLG